MNKQNNSKKKFITTIRSSKTKIFLKALAKSSKNVMVTREKSQGPHALFQVRTIRIIMGREPQPTTRDSPHTVERVCMSKGWVGATGVDAMARERGGPRSILAPVRGRADGHGGQQPDFRGIMGHLPPQVGRRRSRPPRRRHLNTAARASCRCL